MSKLYRVHTVFKQSAPKEVVRYSLIEDLAVTRFTVLHADILRQGQEVRTTAYQNGLTAELMTEAEMDVFTWHPKLAEAVAAHDRDFGFDAEGDAP